MSGTGSARLTIFLDDAGTINDPDVRAGQLRQAVGDFLGRHLGGEADAWAAAHEMVLAGLWDGYRRAMFGNVTADYATFRREWLLGWVRGMCERRGVAAPTEDACVGLALRIEAYATRRVRAAYPGVVDAIRGLHASGHALHTASSEDSAELEGYLEGMGVGRALAGCTGRT